MVDNAASSVVLNGLGDPAPSRALWLVKWLLLIPHALVLVILTPVFVVTTIAAGIAILVTGRYPRGLFDLNVGFLRWTWRFTYYGYGALATDRYPPFSLGANADYPATLDVHYPDHLSRGLVLIKWWLLALPHLFVVGILAGGSISWSVDAGLPDGARLVISGGVIGLLVLIAGVVLLVSGRYPAGLYDVIMGFQRWVYRVIVYVALMTDDYPPFRFDPGGREVPSD